MVRIDGERVAEERVCDHEGARVGRYFVEGRGNDKDWFEMVSYRLESWETQMSEDELLQSD